MVAGPPFVGLTGGIGAGKSEALAALERLGASVISTDKVVHELYADPEVIAADEAVRVQRAGARGHEALDERTARQLSQSEKAARATYAVENSGSLRELEQELSGVLAKLSV